MSFLCPKPLRETSVWCGALTLPGSLAKQGAQVRKGSRIKRTVGLIDRDQWRYWLVRTRAKVVEELAFATPFGRARGKPVRSALGVRSGLAGALGL